MNFKAITSKARFFVIGLIALEIASIPVSAKIIENVAFSKPQSVVSVPFPTQPGVTRFMVSSNSPFAITSEEAIGDFEINIEVRGNLNGKPFGRNAQAPGLIQSCARQTSSKTTKIYEAERGTELREGDILSKTVMVEVRYDATINPNLQIVSKNKAKKFLSAKSCATKQS